MRKLNHQCLLLSTLLLLLHPKTSAQKTDLFSTLEEGEFLEKTVDGEWVYRTLVNSEPFTFQFQVDFQPYNSYLKESMPPLLLYNDPEFDKVKFDEGGWTLNDSAHVLIKFYDISERELDYIFEDFEDSLEGTQIDDVYVGAFIDTSQVPELAVQSFYLTFEDIYYWRFDFIGSDQPKLKNFGLEFIEKFIKLNKDR